MFTQECINRQLLQPLPFKQARQPWDLQPGCDPSPLWNPAFNASLPPSLNPPGAPCTPGSHSLVHRVCPASSSSWEGPWLQENPRAQGCRSIQGTPPVPLGLAGDLAKALCPPGLLHPPCSRVPSRVRSPKPSQGPAVFLGVDFNRSSAIVPRRAFPAVPEIRAAEILNTAAREGQTQRPGALCSHCPQVWRDTALALCPCGLFWQKPALPLAGFWAGPDPPHTDTGALGRRGCVLLRFPGTQRQILG